MGSTIKILAQGCPEAEQLYLEKCNESLELMLNTKNKTSREEIEKKRDKNVVEVDKTISFTQLSVRADAGTGENLFEQSLSQALGTAPKSQKFNFSRLVFERVRIY